MDNSWPQYYTRLAPLLPRLRGRVPILTYHKLGPRPRGARLKGLYVSTPLFRRQLKELAKAGFTNSSVQDACQPGRSGAVITIDDGYVNVLRHGVVPLAEFGFKAMLYLPARLLGKTNEWDVEAGEVPEPIMDEGQVREWLAAGHDIGSHTNTHVRLTKVSTAEAREEIISSRKILEDLFSKPVKHFCYPYGDFNQRTADIAAEAGYATATTTLVGLNQQGSNPFTLKRFTARYQSLNFKALFDSYLRPARHA